MTGILLTLLVILIFVVLYQIGQSSELTALLKSKAETDKRRDLLVAWAFMGFMVIFFTGVYYCHAYFWGSINPGAGEYGKMLPESASDHGVQFDKMMILTTWITGIVFVLTHVLLFLFIYKYRSSENRTTFFFAHSNKLEIAWTTVPAIAMAVLVAFGLINWFKMTSTPPANAQIVEMTGKQFNWISRYPGKDGVLGRRNFKLINDKDNILGLDYTDPHAKDDIIIPNGELRIQKDVPVQLIIGSRDVIHDVGLPHFRMKMDAVPGIVTSIWFTPIISSEEMKVKTKNPNFVYEISCDQMCGKSHYAMRGIVMVDDAAGHKAWMDKQQSYYDQNNAPATPAAAKTDTLKNITQK